MTQAGPRYLRVARVLTLVAGTVLSGCGASIEGDPADGATEASTDSNDICAEFGACGIAVDADTPYDGMTMGTASFDGGATGVSDATPDIFSGFEAGTSSPPDTGFVDAGAAPDDPDPVDGGPLIAPELPAEWLA